MIWIVKNNDMLSKKAQELPLRTLILFIIALIVLVVILLVFIKYSGNIFGRFSEIIKGILSLGPKK